MILERPCPVVDAIQITYNGNDDGDKKLSLTHSLTLVKSMNIYLKPLLTKVN